LGFGHLVDIELCARDEPSDMKRGRASQTAAVVTLMRALADAGICNVKGFSDPTARLLLPANWAQRFEKTLRAKSEGRGREAIKRAADLMAVRTMTIDGHVREAIDAGAKQLVILGAGLDGRAFRMAELGGVEVFEVDHPDTQAGKRERACHVTQTAASLRFVAMNFERGDLGSALQAAGHRADVPTVWLWEGVVMYMTDEALRRTLDIIAQRSATGSTVIVQYNTREGRDLVTFLLTRVWGEPQVGLRTQEEMAQALTGAGFHVRADSGFAEWATLHGLPPEPRGAARRARIVVARR